MIKDIAGLSKLGSKKYKWYYWIKKLPYFIYL